MMIILRLLLFTGVVFAQFGFLEQPNYQPNPRQFTISPVSVQINL
uniref:Neur_chan_LBD domain-containing protein n=1 Tax=Heterorhabditis bacteriophora TaxID=37862 RepID=A0A1I7WRI5_HETBA